MSSQCPESQCRLEYQLENQENVEAKRERTRWLTYRRLEGDQVHTDRENNGQDERREDLRTIVLKTKGL
jgi:hypothetical protein